ncbi:hypothetical protein GTA08_BOTSDO13021 [Neofusicoccum parvum]|uniref:Uncharacterized protein n=1 Tax=Neofusicoccum parvum TaxID=310453 RepID=A0ACB5SJV5_9PEZI|nr:hypothetical protein GTA08_BOTSDO13021 [Neofusicoccum parvum]
MLKTAYDCPKTAKYKSILMALLTMVHISMVSANQEQTECYFLETERFIRVKGLNRKKSRKIRLLHHCYAYERMFYESTFVGRIHSSHRHHIRRAIESSGAAAYSKDSLSFRLSHWDNLEQEMQRVKGCEESENDLHLQLPGVWSDTLHPEIFGVPEPYLQVLSLIIRLGAEKENAEQERPSTLSIKDFTSRAKSLENYMGQVKLWTADTYAKLRQQIPRLVLDNMLDAMQHSLTIYFYRRIYDIDASLLQSKVISVRDCLLRIDSADPSNAYGSVRLIWPAFIAACEAEHPEVQASFSNWFRDSVQRTGLPLFQSTLGRIEQFWEEKCRSDGGRFTWLDFMRKNV